MVKNPPAKQETQVQSLGQEDPLEKEMATHSSILAWRSPWTSPPEEPGGLQFMGSQKSWARLSVCVCVLVTRLCSTLHDLMDFPGVSEGKESACNAGDLGSIPGLGRSPRKWHGSALQHSCLESPHGQRSLAG